MEIKGLIRAIEVFQKPEAETEYGKERGGRGMKPSGIALTISGGMRVTRPTKAEDLIWEAVQEAQAAGWTAKQLRIEFAEAWSESLKRQAAEDAKHFEQWR